MQGKKLILNNFSQSDEHFLFNYSIFNLHKNVVSIGFFVSNSNYNISIAGCLSHSSPDSFHGEILAMEVALHSTLEMGISVKHVFLTNQSIPALLNSFNSINPWHWNEPLSNLKFLLDMMGSPQLHVIPKSWCYQLLILLAMVFICMLLIFFCMAGIYPVQSWRASSSRDSTLVISFYSCCFVFFSSVFSLIFLVF